MPNVKTYYKSKNGNDYLTNNFQVKEFACKDGTDKLLVDLEGAFLLQRFRDYVETPFSPNSAYRTVSHNRAQGGASNSYHLYGRAFDVPFKSTYKYLTSIDKMCAFFNSLGVKGIIKYSWGVHIDTRPTKYHATSSGVYQNYGKVNIPYRNQLLKVGVNGTDVAIAQFKLEQLGYDVYVDGKFGETTKNAVKEFQAQHGLSVDGIIGNATWSKLFQK